MNLQTRFLNYGRVIQHFAAARGIEVLALQASPFLGSYLGGFCLENWSLISLILLMLGSLFLTAHIFIFNDWAGYISDCHDPRRKADTADFKNPISRQHIGALAITLLIFANVAFAAVGVLAVLLLGVGITVLSLIYSWSPYGKSMPIAASFNHLIGGSLHFLLGYTLFHNIDVRGILISIFFGLVFAAGHLNQEVRDYEGDLLNKISTSAVVFGCRKTFLASVCLFSFAYVIMIISAISGILPKFMICVILTFLLHIIWSLQALRRGLGFETAIWMQKRYRFLFAVVGIAMLIN